MKSPISATGGNKSPATKAPPGKTARSSSRKASTASKRRSATRATARKRAPTGYSDAAQRLIDRGKSAVGQASSWAAGATRSLPASARNMQMPSTRAVQSFASDRPWVLGAVGLGIGMVLGSVIPAMNMSRNNHTQTVARARRRK